MAEVITRSEARNRGLVRFYTGEPCKRSGHVSERFTCDGKCIACSANRVRASRAGTKPAKVARVADFSPADDRPPPKWRDPGTRVGQQRILTRP